MSKPNPRNMTYLYEGNYTNHTSLLTLSTVLNMNIKYASEEMYENYMDFTLASNGNSYAIHYDENKRNLLRRAYEYVYGYAMRYDIYLLDNYYNLLTYTKQVFVIGEILEPHTKMYVHRLCMLPVARQCIKGELGLLTASAILSNKPVYVLNTDDWKWYKYNELKDKYILLNKLPCITKPTFTIFTKTIDELRLKHIKELYKRSFDIDYSYK